MIKKCFLQPGESPQRCTGCSWRGLPGSAVAAPDTNGTSEMMRIARSALGYTNTRRRVCTTSLQSGWLRRSAETVSQAMSQNAGGWEDCEVLKPNWSYLLVSHSYLIRFSQAFGEVARPSDRCQRVDFTVQQLPMPSPGESEQDAGFGYKSPAETENQSHGDSKVKESLPFHMDAESESERLTCRRLRCCYELCKSIVMCQNVPETFQIQGQSTVGSFQAILNCSTEFAGGIFNMPPN